MVDTGVIATSYRKNCFWTRTVGIDKPMKRTGHSQIHLLEKEWSDPEQVSSLLKLLLIISISKREGHDKLRRCSKISINWPNAQVSWRWGWLMQNRKSTLHGLNAGGFPSTLTYHRFCDPNWVCKRLKAFSDIKDMKKSAGSLQSIVSSPVGPGQSPCVGTKRQSTRKLSMFGLWESLTLKPVIFC